VVARWVKEAKVDFILTPCRGRDPIRDQSMHQLVCAETSSARLSIRAPADYE